MHRLTGQWSESDDFSHDWPGTVTGRSVLHLADSEKILLLPAGQPETSQPRAHSVACKRCFTTLDGNDVSPYISISTEQYQPDCNVTLILFISISINKRLKWSEGILDKILTFFSISLTENSCDQSHSKTVVCIWATHSGVSLMNVFERIKSMIQRPSS